MKLYPYQKKGVAFIKKNRNVLLMDEQGLGKTAQVISAVKVLSAYPTLIICPASVKEVWVNEFKKWHPNITPTVDTYEKNCRVMITNYERLPRLVDKIMGVKWEMLVCDESHYIKNKKTKRTSLVKEISKIAYRKILITGTPVLNKPIELVSQLDILGVMKHFGKDWDFIKRYCAPYQTPYGWNLDGHDNLKELYRELKPFALRRKKADVLKQLPSKKHEFIPIPLTNIRAYKNAERRYENMVTKENQLVVAHHLRSLCVEGKKKYVIDWIKDFIQSGEKLVIFMYHKSMQEILKEEFPEASTVFGGQTAQSKAKNIQEFQEGSSPIILCSLQSAGVGITLTSASNIVFVEYPWNAGLLNQAIDRVHRISQTKPVTIWHLYGKDTIEQRMMCMIEHKEISTSIITDGKSVTNNLIQGLIEAD